LKQENAWEKSDRNAITVFKTNQLTIVLVALKAGASLLPHQVSAIASVQILKGKAEFTSEEGQKELVENNIIILHSNEMFNITALEETNILVTIIEEY
jgi:quercetin dioxygenase-like cupin family protein